MQQGNDSNSARLEVMFHHAPVPLIVTGLDGTITDINDTAAAMYGQDAKQCTGKNLKDLSARDYVHFKRKTEQLLNYNSYESEVIVKTLPDGSRAYLLSSYFLFYDPSTGQRLVQITCQDVTQREVALYELDRARHLAETVQNQLRVITENSPSVIFEIRPDGTILYVNRTFFSITGLSDPVGKSIYELITRTEGQTLRAHIETACRSNVSVEFELKTKLSDKQFHYFFVRANPVADPLDPENVQSVIVNGLDISAKKLMEQKLETAMARAESANRAKTNFLMGMSHDIRTPMNAIAGIAEILAQGQLTDDQRKLTDMLLGSSKTLLSLLDRILQLSSIEAGTLKGTYETDMSLIQSVRRAIDLFKLETDQSAIEIELIPHGVIPQAVKCQESSLLQILVNLIGNAVKYSPKNKKNRIQVHLSVQTGDESDPLVTVSVSDEGPGIPSEDLPHVFDMFFRSEDTAMVASGSGIGLPGSQRIANALGGNITIVSPNPELKNTDSAGPGTLVKLTVPVRTADGPKNEVPVKHVSLRNKSILVVEDNPTNQVVVQRILSLLECKSTVVETIAEAKPVVEKDNFDAILLDLGLPDGDGRNLARYIREFDQSVPIIALTAEAFEEQKLSALASGMNDFLTKPVSIDTLKTALQKSQAGREKPDVQPE